MGVVSRQEGVGNLGVLGAGAACAGVAVGSFSSFGYCSPTGLAPRPRKRQLGNRAEGEDGVGSLGGGERTGVQVGKHPTKFPLDKLRILSAT